MYKKAFVSGFDFSHCLNHTLLLLFASFSIFFFLFLFFYSSSIISSETRLRNAAPGLKVVTTTQLGRVAHKSCLRVTRCVTISLTLSLSHRTTLTTLLSCNRTITRSGATPVISKPPVHTWLSVCIGYLGGYLTGVNAFSLFLFYWILGSMQLLCFRREGATQHWFLFFVFFSPNRSRWLLCTSSMHSTGRVVDSLWLCLDVRCLEF